MKSTPVFFLTFAMITALPGFAAVKVKPVPWDPTNLISPHTVISTVSATLTATVDLGGSADSFTYQWNFGDASSSSSNPVSTSNNSSTVGTFNNLSAAHTYSAAPGTAYTAVLTVTDTTTSATYTGNYYVVVQGNTLSARVNTAIDNGLWYLHTTMDRTTTTTSAVNGGYTYGPIVTLSPAVAIGGWDGQLGQSCLGSAQACLNSVGLDSTNVQAFEVSGHYENEASAAADPYADDVARGLARLMMYMQPEANSEVYIYSPFDNPSNEQKTITYNPALSATRCSDGSMPASYGTASQNCTGHGTLINYNPGATSCTSPPCALPYSTYDGNGNGQVLMFAYNVDGEGNWGYQTGMVVTAIVASQNPSGIARTGAGSGTCESTGDSTPAQTCPGVLGQTYLNIVQDLIDGIGFCQYYGDAANTDGYNNGGGWEYYCSGAPNLYNNYDDNSPSQWNGIAMIAANRGFGITIPPVVKDTNQVWMTWDEDLSDANAGLFGYNAWNSYPWGPWAVTPSGMVQLAMDGVGRTAAGNPDQRWNLAESQYRDNFCNTGGATNSPRNYTYGMFSFTKAMEQHDPGGVLTPITKFSDQPSGANMMDWYAALSPANGGTDACDGVAQTLVARQFATGYWTGQDYEYPQTPFETAWSTIMLQKTSFVACVTNLGGAGKASSRSAGAEITLSWSGIGDATSYQVLRGTASGGPYTDVGSPIPGLAFVDQTAGLVNGHTYYYVLQPLVGSTSVCQSNQATITIP